VSKLSKYDGGSGERDLLNPLKVIF